MEKKTILAVEDEKMVACLLETAFGEIFSDHNVVVKGSCKNGMEFALANLDLIEAAFLDGDLGDGKGYQIADEMRKNGYNGLIISISAYPLNSIPEPYRQLFNCNFLKPFNSFEAAREIKEFLLSK